MTRLPLLYIALTTLAFAATPSQARAPVWLGQSGHGSPVASVTGGGGRSIAITCVGGANMGYFLVVKGPAGGLRAGRGVKVVVEGRRRIKLRVDRVAPLPGGLVRLSSFGGYRGSTGDQSGTLEAIESIRTSRGPITVTSGGFRVTVPATGVEAAMAPLVKQCGDLRKMIKRAEGREGELN
ncbi:MAG: hypothetical protein Q8L66_03920 [Caulobacter sp.]|nr:hypothetical protein [Caulobacter sp.]